MEIRTSFHWRVNNFFRARKHNNIGKWIEERTIKYGPVFKTSLMGENVVVKLVIGVVMVVEICPDFIDNNLNHHHFYLLY